MSSMQIEDVLVVASVLGLVLTGLAISLKSGSDAAIDRDHPWRRMVDTITQTLITLAGWGASLAAIQHVVGPRF